MTTPTLSPKDAAFSLEELAEKHCDLLVHGRFTAYHFEIEQLHALIEEAVGIVKGDVAGWKHNESGDSIIYSTDEMKCFPYLEQKFFTPLHAIDMGRLK